MGKPRYFALRGIAVHYFFLRRANDHRFGFGHRRKGARPVASSYRFFDLAHSCAQARAPRLIDRGAAGNLARGFLGGFGVGHDDVKGTLGSGAYRGARCPRQRLRVAISVSMEHDATQGRGFP